jgi:class 3 adenylate cyclase
MGDVSSTPSGVPLGPRLSDQDRERVIDFLKTSCGEGRLTLDEFSERVEATYQAASIQDLPPVLADLPHPFGVGLAGVLNGDHVRSPLPVASQVLDRAGGRKLTRWTVSIMSGSRNRGRWRLREKTTAVAIMGGCVLDLRNAEVEGTGAVINAIVVMGSIEIVVPEGIEVELGGIAIMGGKNDRRHKNIPPLPGSPVLRVRAFAFWGGVIVRSKRVRPHLSNGQTDSLPRHVETSGESWPSTSEMPPGRRLIDVVAEGPIDSGDDFKVDGLPEGTVTIMFSDIEGFTSMTERLGDRRAMDILRDHNGIIRRRIASCGGHEIKAQGDGFMIAFSGASRALECAIGIQRDLANRNSSNPGVPVKVRLGLHSGEAVRDGGDFLGGSVILAARIAQQAEGGEILASSVLKELCDLSGEFRFADGRDVYLKGLSEPRRVYTVTGPEIEDDLEGDDGVPPDSEAP